MMHSPKLSAPVNSCSSIGASRVLLINTCKALGPAIVTMVKKHNDTDRGYFLDYKQLPLKLVSLLYYRAAAPHLDFLLQF